MNFINKDLTELEKMLEQYKEIKLRFIRNEDTYNESEKSTFKNNFYNKKLDILLSIIYNLYNNKELTIHTNPFMRINNYEEEKQYTRLICLQLSNLDTKVISMDINLLNNYDKLKNMIKDMKNKFIYNINFWEYYINFYIRYNRIKL